MSYFTAFRIPLAMTAITLSVGQVQSEPPTVRELLQRAAAHVSAIRNYEFTVVERVQGDSSFATSPVFTTFYQEGDMFRSEIRNEGLDPEKGAANTISAFDGSTYQQYYQKLDTLTFSSANRFPNPYMKENPLLQPFIWAFQDSQRTWNVLRESEPWTLLEQRASVVGSKRIRGYECDLLELTLDSYSGTAVVEVGLAQELRGYPISVAGTMNDKGERFELNVLEHMTIDGSTSQDCVIPTHITLVERHAQPRSWEWRILPNTVHVNHEIPIELFTLSPSMASTIDDYDRNMTRMIEEGSIVRETPMRAITERSQVRQWLLLLNAAVVIVLAVLLICQYWNRLRAARSDNLVSRQ